jgi:hypothetical protein
MVWVSDALHLAWSVECLKMTGAPSKPSYGLPCMQWEIGGLDLAWCLYIMCQIMGTCRVSVWSNGWIWLFEHEVLDLMYYEWCVIYSANYRVSHTSNRRNPVHVIFDMHRVHGSTSYVTLRKKQLGVPSSDYLAAYNPYDISSDLQIPVCTQDTLMDEQIRDVTVLRYQLHHILVCTMLIIGAQFRRSSL